MEEFWPIHGVYPWDIVPTEGSPNPFIRGKFLTTASERHFAVLMYAPLGERLTAEEANAVYWYFLVNYIESIDQDFPAPPDDIAIGVFEGFTLPEQRLRGTDAESGLTTITLLAGGSWFVITEAHLTMDEFFE